MNTKLLLYLDNDQLCAYEWSAGQLSACTRFPASREGHEAFDAYLDERACHPVYIVADLVEEEFQRVLLPHVPGSAGRKLLARRLAQVYRDTPYRQACIQGRADEGRRDDHVMLSALTNPAALQPWVSLLEQHRQPLAAVYSAAFLSAQLLKSIRVWQDHLLLITQHAGGLRQSYFHGHELKFSRLTALEPEQGETAISNAQLADTVAGETTRMQQFLTSTHLLDRTRVLRVVVLAPSSRMAELEARCADSPDLAFHFIDLEGVAHQLHMGEAPALADRLLLALVGRQAPSSHYELGDSGRFYQLWETRRRLQAATATVAALALLTAAVDTWRIVDHARTGRQLLAEAQRLDNSYRTIMASLPPTAAKPANMKAAVLVADMLARQDGAPAPLLARVGQAMELAPALRLTTLDWQVAPQAKAVDQPLVLNNGEALLPISAAAVGVPSTPPQVLRIDGEVDTAPGDYRGTLASMNMLVLELGRMPGIQVQVLAAPVDVRENAKLTGKSGADEAPAKPGFSLKVSFKP